MLNVSLTGKVAWVTGGSGGLGASIVEALHAAGAQVVSTDMVRPPSAVDSVDYRTCDVTAQEDIDATVRYCLGQFGRLDILVNNAGIQRQADVFEISRETWSAVMDVNMTAYFFCAQAAAKAMRDNKVAGSIVNIVSASSDYARPEIVPYCVSKGGAKTLTKSLAVALGSYGIRVNGVSPGTVRTNINRERLDNSGEGDRIARRTPLGRLGVPADIAPAVAFLASDHAAFTTGSILDVHGGRVLVA